MGNGKIIKCKACGAEIAKGIKSCPQCGADNRSIFAKHKIITALVILFLIGSIGSLGNGTGTSSGTTQNTTKKVATLSSEEKTILTKSYKDLTDSEKTMLKDIEGKFVDLDAATKTEVQANYDKIVAEETRQKKINSQFSAWDGSHINLTNRIKDSMNDPKSYEHVETVYWDRGDYLVVQTTFRGKNAFGGVVKNTVKAKVDLEGNVVEVIDQN